jgi:beta-N-acetylhexosaminidase
MKKALAVFVILVVFSAVGWLVWITVINQKISVVEKQNNNPVIRQTVPSFIDSQLSSMNLKQKIASLMILHKPGTNTNDLKEYLATNQPGGLIFMSDNIPDDVSQLKSLTDELQTNDFLPYLFAIDQEGGVVERLSGDIYPSAMELKDQPVTATIDAFNKRSKLVSDTGMNLNFGIVADVTSDVASFIYSRVFGGDPAAVGDRIAAAVLSSKGLTLSTLKHFPGHGEAEADSHISIPTTNISFEEWQKRDKQPFVSGVDSGADVVMFGHLRYSSVDDKPASLSSKWHDILAKDLNFKGITVTDDMTMLHDSGEAKYNNPTNNAINAIIAGNTMLLYVLGNDNSVNGVKIDEIINGIASAVESGKIGRDLIDINVRKVLEVRHSLADI